MMPPITMQDSWLEIIARNGQCSAGEARSMAAEIIRRRKEDQNKSGGGVGMKYPYFDGNQWVTSP